jgi:hypothetical protein
MSVQRARTAERLDACTAKPYSLPVYTVVETPLFQRLADGYWTEEERSAFVFFIASHPEAGNVVPGSGGVRKVRWRMAGGGKRGGVRVIYFNRLSAGEIWLLVLHAKSEAESIPTHILRQIKEEIEHG